MAITNEILDKILKDYKSPEDLTGQINLTNKNDYCIIIET